MVKRITQRWHRPSTRQSTELLVALWFALLVTLWIAKPANAAPPPPVVDCLAANWSKKSPRVMVAVELMPHPFTKFYDACSSVWLWRATEKSILKVKLYHKTEAMAHVERNLLTELKQCAC